MANAIRLKHQIEREIQLSSDPAITGMTGGERYWNTTTKEFQVYDAAASSPAFVPLCPDVPFGPFSYEGPLAVHTGTKRFYWGGVGPMKLVAIRGHLEVPTSTNVRVDINKNGTTIHTTQSNRLNLNVGNGGVDSVTTIEVNTISPGDYYTFDVDNDGGGAAGLTFTLFLRRAFV